VTTTIRYDNYYGYIPWQGDTVGRNVYSAYGELTDQLNASWTNSNVEVAFDGPLYCGYWFDTDTGLYQVRNRYYDPGLSTWINRDPIGYSGGTSNLYCYCGCNPTNRIDPNGTTILSHSKIDTYLTQYVVGVGHKTSANEWLYSEVTANAAGNALRTEILTRMIKSTYQFHVKGTTEKECLDNIKKNVESRVNILRLAEAKKYGFGAGSAYHENSTVPGLNYKTNPLAYFNSINNAGTTIACQFATMLTFYAGIGTWGANSGSRMLSGIEDVIPGDWSYIYNDANNTNKTGLQDPNWEPGLEGENVIYVGANRFWGHISGEQVVETWQQWFADMRAWKSKDGTQSGKPRMDRDVKFSTLGLQ
jgi:RHS repeat-associated protein